MFGKKKAKAPEDPRVELARNLVPKKHAGFDANMGEVVKYIPGSSTILAVLPARGFSADCWILTDKAIHLWSPLTQMVIPLNTNIVASKGIGSLKVGSNSSDTVSISAHPGNLDQFYQVLMSRL